MTTRVAIAAPHVAGVDAARAVTGRGGGALDAVIAAAAALTVAYPHQCSVGGDLVAVVRPAGGAPRAVLSVGAAPAGLDVGGLRAAGPRMPPGGPLSVTVPGCVAGWAAVHRLGARLDLAELVAPAVELARRGVGVSAGLARAISRRSAVVEADPGLSALLLDDAGRPRGLGTTITQPALAATLTAVGAGWRTFYTGAVGARLVAGLRKLGCPLTTDDMAAHAAEDGPALCRDALGATWSVAPPPSQGASLLAMLRSDGDRLTTARRAELARDTLLGDPRGGPIDVASLLLEREPAGTPVAPGPRPAGDTVAITAVDDTGTAVSLIQSVYQSFGAGILEPETGVVLHNRGSAFALDPAHPGAVRPGHRPPHTLCPVLAERGDDVVALGCQGGRAQAWILAQTAEDVLGTSDPAGVLARPRWVIGSRDLGRERPSLVLEPGVPDAEGLSAAARALSLDVDTVPELHDDAGHVQVARLRAGVLDAASDVRADGAADVLGGG
ncbi:Gamma-glutamyltranspeptidase [Pseudonocardia sp. Ae717_Ps2]|uniref:gamma-glutamyltransferase n=1 Tax=Pseudonocardia sp. Ae717_Ps2 TaxID=1885573 RepID=UPI00094AE22D|nr:gamma-glutamyltransferase [Pseudonocardia sp. Ae717_Ps2]OLM30067.1 Gamma-glutamyltranspeptidase [Pseudonocardia sp. Ae717_Ps2]